MKEVTEKVRLAALARYWSQVKVGSPEQCWPWQGRMYATGYGEFSGAGFQGSASRALFVLSGIAVKGLVVDHQCRNRACVNPAHLRAVTQQVNCVENSVGLAAKNAAKTHCPKGHPYEGSNLVRNSSGGRLCRECLRQKQARISRMPKTPKGTRYRRGKSSI